MFPSHCKTERISICFVILLGALAGPVSLHAQSALEPLSLDEALKLAAGRSRALTAQEFAATAAREQAAAAGVGADPVLLLGIDNLPVTGPDAYSLSDDFMTMRSVGISRELTSGDKRKARTLRFEREAEAALAGRSLVLANTQRDTALAWLDRHFSERKQALLGRQRDEALLQLQAADSAYRGGSGMQGDLFSARMAVAAMDERILTAARDAQLASIRLERWIGAAADRPLAASEATFAQPLDHGAIESLLAHHPLLVMLERREQAARAAADLARANQRPDWSVAFMYSLRGSDYSDMVSVSVSRPLAWRRAQRQDRELAAQLATAEQLAAEREEESRAHRSATLELQQAWRSNLERLKLYNSRLIPLAGERSQAVLAAYRGRGATLAEVLDARQAEITTQLEALELEREASMQWAELNFLVPEGTGLASNALLPNGGSHDGT